MPEASSRPVIVYADHSGLPSRVMAKMLERVGIEADLLHVPDCYTAIRLRFDEVPPAMLILRGAMPGLDGPDAIAEIRRREAVEDVPRIPLVIASGGLDFVSRGIEAGADAAFEMPFSADDVRTVFSALLAPGFRGPIPRPEPSPAPSGSPPLPALPPVDPGAIRVHSRRILVHDRGNRLVLLREWLATQPDREVVTVVDWDLALVAKPCDLAVVEMIGVGMSGAFHINAAREGLERIGRPAPAFVLVVADVMGGRRMQPGTGLRAAWDSAMGYGVGDVPVLSEAELVAILDAAAVG